MYGMYRNILKQNYRFSAIYMPYIKNIISMYGMLMRNLKITVFFEISILAIHKISITIHGIGRVDLKKTIGFYFYT